MYLISLPGWTMNVFISIYILMVGVCLWNVYIRPNKILIKILLALAVILFPPFVPMYLLHITYRSIMDKRSIA